MERKSIAKITKELVLMTQGPRCACCIERGQEYHHVKPVALGGTNDYTNIVLLCKEHHRLLHLGDFETIVNVLEYVYFLRNDSLPEDYSEMHDLARSIMRASKY